MAAISGYNYDFVEPPPDSLLCLICTFVAREPMQMDCCGRVYCNACLTEHKKHSRKCPNCRKEGNDFKDWRSERDIKALKVKCGNLKNGCRGVRELAALDTHLEMCGHALSPCPNECKVEDKVVQLLRKDIETHCRNKCPNRSYMCLHCREEGKHCDITTSHLKTCPQLEVPCPNGGCKERLPRCKIPDHWTKCPFEKVDCKYSKIGCKDKPLRKELAEHENNDQLHLHISMETMLKREDDVSQMQSRLNKLETDSKEHTSQMHSRLNKLETDSKEYTSLMQSHNDKLEIGRKEHTGQMETRLNKIETESKGYARIMQTRLNKLKTENKQHTSTSQMETRLNKIEAESKEYASKMQTRLIKLETECKEHTSKVQSRLDNVDDKIAQVITTASSQFVYKVSNFSQRKSSEEQFCCPPFYSHQGGYKMCLGVDPNGYGDGKGTHVSVYAYLIRGENDDTLTWPFTGTVTVELLNQLEDEQHHQMIFTYREGKDEDYNRRVVDTERSSGYGYPKFISHLALDHRLRLICQYLKDDCLYFRVSVKAVPNPKPWLACTV